MKTFLFYSISAVLFTILFSACDASETEQAKKPSPVLSVNNRPNPVEVPEALLPDSRVETLTEKEPVRFHYDAKGRRDPFQSSVISRKLRKPPRISRSLPPLQRKDISDLKLIGILWGSFGPRAIITTSDGKGYTVDIGARVGINHGIIREITRNEVVVEETLVNIFGEPKKSEVVMMLHPEKERVE